MGVRKRVAQIFQEHGDAIRRRYVEGFESYVLLAKEYNLSSQALRQYLVDAGVTIRRAGYFSRIHSPSLSARDERIIDAYINDPKSTIYSIAKLEGVSSVTVWRVLQSAGCTRKKRSLQFRWGDVLNRLASQKTVIIERYARGESLTKLAVEFKTTVKTLRSLMSDWGIRLRSKEEILQLRISPERRRRIQERNVAIVDMYQNGCSYVDIMKAYPNLSCGQIKTILLDSGVKLRSRSEAIILGCQRRNAKRDRQIIELFALGCSKTNIARIIGVSYTTVSTVISRNLEPSGED